MSNKNIINAFKNDNYKIIQNEKKGNDLKEDNLNEDNSFNQLLSLQLLIQKHSGLKELCKKKFFIIYLYSY